MEDEKLAAYYDDLTRRGGGAARFKQGLGFSSAPSSSDDAVPSRGSALPTTSSFLSSFVRASSPSKTAEYDRQAQLQSIQNKLSQNPREKVRSSSRSRSPSKKSAKRSRSQSQSRSPRRDKYREKHSRRRSRSRDRHTKRRSRSRSRDRRSRRSRSRSRSREYDSRRKNRSRSRSRSRERNKERSKRQGSPEKSKKGNGGSRIDYAKLIEGYDNMTPAERVKAKMKLQLSKTAENDDTIGKGMGWERFEFNKDAPLEDEEIEAAEDDADVVKHMGQSFRFSAVEAKREERIKAAHDEAIFGGSSYPIPAKTDDDEAQEESHTKKNIESAPAASLLSNQVLMKQQGSWRDRLRKP